MKTRSPVIGSLNYLIALKFNMPVGSSIAKVSLKCQSNRTILSTNPKTLWYLTIRRLMRYWNRAQADKYGCNELTSYWHHFVTASDASVRYGNTIDFNCKKRLFGIYAWLITSRSQDSCRKMFTSMLSCVYLAWAYGMLYSDIWMA